MQELETRLSQACECYSAPPGVTGAGTCERVWQLLDTKKPNSETLMLKIDDIDSAAAELNFFVRHFPNR